MGTPLWKLCVQVIGLFGGNLVWGPLLGNYLCPSYWVIWLFGRNLMLGPRLGSCVSKLLGYLVIWQKSRVGSPHWGPLLWK